MYGPEETTCSLYVDGFSLSYFAAYSCGTGAVIGMISDAAKPGACAFVSVNVISCGLPGFLGQPWMKLKYVVYWFGTFFVAARSKAYLTSFASTSRLTGGP